MTRLTRDPWQRVSRRRPCPVCGKPDWCLFAGPADAPPAAICTRVESPKRAGEAGYLHELRTDGPTWAPWRRTIARAVRLATETRGGPDLAATADRWRLPDDSPRLARLAATLGLSAKSLHRLAAGWSPDHRAWAFPMTDVTGQVVGIRLRSPSGRKWSVRGGREGLFLPDDLQPDGQLLICEGPSDTAACLDWGFSAVGRPSCTGGMGQVVELVKRLRLADVAVVADGDAPGERGAERLAAVLAAYVRVVKVITPPHGLKDARAWLRAGATPGDVLAAIDAAPVRRLKVAAIKKGR